MPVPRSAVGDRLELARFAPSGRSLLTALLILLTAVGLYAAARTTAMFAVDEIAVTGTSPEVGKQLRDALAPTLGESLLGLDLAELEQRAERVPMVAAAALDRSFPHTLALTIVPEVPVAVLRQGASSWLAAEGGRVVAELEQGERPRLPRLWLKRDVDVRVGEWLRGPQLRAVNAVAPLARHPLPHSVAAVASSGGELTLQLRSGLELRLGDHTDLEVKLEVARRVLPELGTSDGYLDVSVPERPVASESLDPQVDVEGSVSTVTEGTD